MKIRDRRLAVEKLDLGGHEKEIDEQKHAQVPNIELQGCLVQPVTVTRGDHLGVHQEGSHRYEHLLY